MRHQNGIEMLKIVNLARLVPLIFLKLQVTVSFVALMHIKRSRLLILISGVQIAQVHFIGITLTLFAPVPVQDKLPQIMLLAGVLLVQLHHQNGIIFQGAAPTHAQVVFLLQIRIIGVYLVLEIFHIGAQLIQVVKSVPMRLHTGTPLLELVLV